jgi:hypothetical protein
MTQIDRDEEIPEILESVAKVAGEVVTFALLNEIKIESIDPDALGGVAIYLSSDTSRGYSFKELWVSLLNNGSQTIVGMHNTNQTASTLDYNFIMDFLFSD